MMWSRLYDGVYGLRTNNFLYDSINNLPLPFRERVGVRVLSAYSIYVCIR